MDIMSCEDILYETPYSLCGFCRCKIAKRDDARWVDLGTEWKQISCTECAGKHPPGHVYEVEVPFEVEEIIEIDQELDELRERKAKLEKDRVRYIKDILKQEGYAKDVEVYFRNKLYIITGLKIGGLANRTSVKVELAPAKKDGSAGKYNKTELKWNEFIRLYRMQRADVEGYLEHCRQHEEEIKRRRNMKIKLEDLE